MGGGGSGGSGARRWRRWRRLLSRSVGAGHSAVLSGTCSRGVDDEPSEAASALAAASSAS